MLIIIILSGPMLVISIVSAVKYSTDSTLCDYGLMTTCSFKRVIQVHILFLILIYYTYFFYE